VKKIAGFFVSAGQFALEWQIAAGFPGKHLQIRLRLGQNQPPGGGRSGQIAGELNRHLKGWTNYFSIGYPTGAYREIDWYVCGRLIQHLQRRSQRPFRPPEGVSWYQHLPPWGLALLSGHAHA